jgi:uncharacterized protein (TIGR02722 family)
MEEYMKISVFFLCAVMAVLAGCASGPAVTRVDASAQTNLTGRWDDSDVREVCEALLAEALSSPRIDSFISEFQSRNRGALPTVIVGRFANTSSEHIDTTIISGIMRTTIINSGKLEFVEGGNVREELRSERQDQQFNASEDTAAALGNETGANLMLTGEVNSTVQKSGNRTVRAYFVKASLTNIETNRIMWEGQYNEIKREVVQPRTRL